MRNLTRIMPAVALVLGLFAVGDSGAHAQGQQPGQGMMGPGMMGQGYMPCYNMMGQMPMMSPGMMGQGMMGQGQGMMGPGMMGMGPGMMMGQGMMAQGGGMMGPGMMMGPMMGMGQQPANITVDDVKGNLERWLAWHGNARLKVGDVSEKDQNTITAEIVTVDNSLVQTFDVDRRTGMMWPARQ